MHNNDGASSSARTACVLVFDDDHPDQGGLWFTNNGDLSGDCTFWFDAAAIERLAENLLVAARRMRVQNGEAERS